MSDHQDWQKGGTPYYNVVVRIPDPEDPTRAIGWHQVGVAWKRRNGTISLKLEVGSVLDWRLTQEFAVMLLENKPRGERHENSTRDL